MGDTKWFVSLLTEDIDSSVKLDVFIFLPHPLDSRFLLYFAGRGKQNIRSQNPLNSRQPLGDHARFKP